MKFERQNQQVLLASNSRYFLEGISNIIGAKSADIEIITRTFNHKIEKRLAQIIPQFLFLDNGMLNHDVKHQNSNLKEDKFMNLVRNKLYRLSIIVIILTSFAPVSLFSKSVEGAMVSSQMILSGGKTTSRGMDEAKVRQMLENKIVAERLKNHGLSKEEVMVKMDRMSDEQIHQLAALSDRIPAGGDGAATAAVIVLVVFVIAILMLIILRRI